LADPELRDKFKIPYTIKAMYQNAGNEFRSMANTEQTEKAIKGIEFIVSHALFVDDPTLFADVVLPDPSSLERLVIQQYIRLQQVDVEGIFIKQPVVEPLYNTRPVADVLLDLAERLGFLNGDGGYLDLLNKGMIEGGRPWGFGATTPEPRLDIDGNYTWEEIVDVVLTAAAGEGKGLDWFKEHGLLMKKYSEDHDAKETHLWAPHFGRRFPIYFEPLLGYGEMLKDRVKENLGMDWDVSWYEPLPRWVPCPEHDASSFPPGYDLYTVNFKTPMNTHSTSASNVWLAEVFEADPYFLKIWMNEETGKKKGLRDGDKVLIESLVHKTEGRVKLSEAIHPDAVGIAGAQGSWATSPFAKKGINYASLIPMDRETHINPMLCSHEWCTRVKITKQL
ncbi:MAG: molybdopterin dinucleotide binding domain-containing protein, partial [candidate division NC10 bacterium]